MDDPQLEEVAVTFHHDRICVKWRYPDEDYRYSWFDRQ